MVSRKSQPLPTMPCPSALRAGEEGGLGGAGDGRQDLAQRSLPARLAKRRQTRSVGQQTRGQADGVQQHEHERIRILHTLAKPIRAP